jgi:hypothetical protein
MKKKGMQGGAPRPKVRWTPDQDVVVTRELRGWAVLTAERGWVVKTLEAHREEWNEAVGRIAFLLGHTDKNVFGHKQVFERYYNHLSPDLNGDAWTQHEIATVMRQWSEGKKALAIALALPRDGLGRRRSNLKVTNLIHSSVRRLRDRATRSASRASNFQLPTLALSAPGVPSALVSVSVVPVSGVPVSVFAPAPFTPLSVQPVSESVPTCVKLEDVFREALEGDTDCDTDCELFFDSWQWTDREFPFPCLI